MEEKLAKLVYSYSRENKEVDTQFIEDAFVIICDSLSLETTLLIKSNSLLGTGSLATYSNSPNLLKMYTSKINNFIISELTEFQLSTDNSLFKYIFFIKILLHEIEHLKQYEIIQYKNNAEGLIIHKVLEVDDKFSTYDSYLQLLHHYLFYDMKCNKLYRYSPMERLAEIRANKTASYISGLLEDGCTTLIMLFYYYSALISAYKFGRFKSGRSEPTKYYFDSLKTKLNWNKIMSLSESDLMNVELGLKADNNFLFELREKELNYYRKLSRFSQ